VHRKLPQLATPAPRADMRLQPQAEVGIASPHIIKGMFSSQDVVAHRTASFHLSSASTADFLFTIYVKCGSLVFVKKKILNNIYIAIFAVLVASFGYADNVIACHRCDNTYQRYSFGYGSSNPYEVGENFDNTRYFDSSRDFGNTTYVGGTQYFDSSRNFVNMTFFNTRGSMFGTNGNSFGGSEYFDSFVFAGTSQYFDTNQMFSVNTSYFNTTGDSAGTSQYFSNSSDSYAGYGSTGRNVRYRVN